MPEPTSPRATVAAATTAASDLANAPSHHSFRSSPGLHRSRSMTDFAATKGIIPALQASTSTTTKRDWEAFVGDKDTETIDLRSLEITSSYDEELDCPICRVPLIDPERLSCEHVFCRTCLQQARRAAELESDLFNCPVCRSPQRGPPHKVHRPLKTMLQKLKVKCPNYFYGCQETMPREGIQSHVNKECEFSVLHCEAVACGKGVMRKDIKEPCLHLEMACPGCKVSLFKRDLEEHRTHYCKNNLTPCLYCSLPVNFPDMKQHHREECTHAPLKCKAAKFGCRFVGVRDDITQHHQDCSLAQLSKYLTTQQYQVDKLSATVSLQQQNLKYKQALVDQLNAQVKRQKLQIAYLEEQQHYLPVTATRNSRTTGLNAHPTTNTTTGPSSSSSFTINRIEDSSHEFDDYLSSIYSSPTPPTGQTATTDAFQTQFARLAHPGINGTSVDAVNTALTGSSTHPYHALPISGLLNAPPSTSSSANLRASLVSLQDGITSLNNDVHELETRVSSDRMEQINDRLRFEQDTMALRAGQEALRISLVRFAQGLQYRNAAAAMGGPATAAAAAAGGGSGARTQSVPPTPGSAAGAGGASVSGSGASVQGPVRRLSDGARGETKL